MNYNVVDVKDLWLHCDNLRGDCFNYFITYILMENKRWLNIVVDGNKAMEHYWIDIVSNYLEKIVRCFIGERQEHENYLGLVIYNANSELVEAGYDMQFINWTKDVNKYMENLSRLSFNGNDLNQSSMAEGLAEALVMYPKPCDTMTEREYYNAERHCILVAPGDPAPKIMPVCVPMIQKAQVIGQRLQACQIDFLDVAKKCVPLAVSLSVITPNPAPIFGAIFNLGNNVLTLSNAPVCSYSTGQLTILLSKNFKEAHSALKEKRIVDFPSTSVGSINTTPDSTLFRVLNLQEESESSQATIGAIISEACNDLTPESVSNSQPFDSQELIFPNGTDHQANVASPNSQVQINLYEDIMAELNSDIFPPVKRSRTFTPFEEDNDLINFFELNENPFSDINHSFGQEQGVSFEKQISAEGLIEVENELEKALNVAPNDQTSNVEFTPSSSKVVNFTPLDIQTPVSNVSNTGEGSSTGLFYENTSQSWYNPRGLTNTSTLDSSQFQSTVSSGNFAFPDVLRNSLLEPQAYSSTSQVPMFPSFSRESMVNFSVQPPMGQHFQAYNQYRLRNNMAPFNSSAFGANGWIHSAPGLCPSYQNSNLHASSVPGLSPSYQNSNLYGPSAPGLSPSYQNSNLYAPSLDDLQNYVHTWEGNLAGKINSSRITVIKARAFRKITTPISLTLTWSGRLEISHLIPLKAVNHTKKFSHPIDHVFFHVVKYNNVDLYKHLKSKYLCAKIDLHYQSIILSPTEREHFFVGTVFPGETLFIEPA